MSEPMRILRRVHAAIQERDPSVLARGERWRPGGIFELQEHTLFLIERSIRAQSRRPIPPDRLCDRCFYLTPTRLCPHRSRCVLYQHSQAVIEAIAAALKAE